MLKKIMSMLLVILVVNLSIAFAATNNETKEAKFAEKVKTEIAKLGIGTEAKVKVKLKDGRKLKGYVSEAGDEQFTVIETKTKQAVPVSYSQVKQVSGNNLSKGTIITLSILGIIIALAIIGASAK